MARTEFGGVMAAWIINHTATETGIGPDLLTLPPTGVTVDVYDAPGGAQLTDLLDLDGNTISTLTLPDGDAYLPRFFGPDGLDRVWIQAATGAWLPVPRFDETVATAVGDVSLAGGNVQEYADSQAEPWLILRRPDDGTDSSTWPNMLEVYYWDTGSSQYRLGFYLNEKGLLRARGTTPSDVAARFMAHPTQGSTTAILETTLSDNTQKLLQVFTTQVVSNVGMQAPYVANPAGERLYFGSADPATDAAYASHRPRAGDAWLDYNGEA